MGSERAAASAASIAPVVTPDDVAAARQLFVEYQDWLGIDLCFQGFQQELAALPGEYSPPSGRLLLARRNDEVAGCVALRPLDAQRCEMKRLFVRPRHHGHGLGRRLVTTLIAEASTIGDRVMLLDTLPKMEQAQRLYRALGCRDTEPYRHHPVPGARYLALDLKGPAGGGKIKS